MSKPTGGSENLPPADVRLRSLEERVSELQSRLEAAERFESFVRNNLESVIATIERVAIAMRSVNIGCESRRK